MRRSAFGVALIAIAASACAGTPDKSPAAPLTKVRMSFSKHLSWGPLMIAQAEGFFRDEGLEVEFVTQLRPEESLVALVTGDIDVRPAPISAGFLSAIARQAPIRIVAGMANLGGSCTYHGILLRPGYDSVGGKPHIRRMRTGTDGANRYITSRLLEKENVSIKDIESVRLPEAVFATALENGSLDAVVVTEPGLSRLKTRGATLWLSGQDVVPGFQWAVVEFGDRLLNRDRETGMRFIRAYLRGIAQYRQGKTDRNVAIIADGTQETPEHIRDVCWPDFNPEGRINWESIAVYQAWLKSESLMLKTVSREQAFDSAFVTAAVRDSSAGVP